MKYWRQIILTTTIIMAPLIAHADECEDEFRILETAPLAFGRLTLSPEGDGVVIVSPLGGTATVGGVAPGQDAQPAMIRICGPAHTEFELQLSVAELDLAAGKNEHRPHLVSDLEAVVSGGQLHPVGPAEWKGVLGPRGRAQLHIGGTLTVPRFRERGLFAERIEIFITRID